MTIDQGAEHKRPIPIRITGVREGESERGLFSPGRDLSPIDHMLIGSTVEVGGKTFDTKRFMEEARLKQLTAEHFIPRGIQFPLSQDDAHLLEERRSNQRALSNNFFQFLGEDQLDLFGKNQRILLQPVGIINPKSGVVDPVWRVSVVDVKGAIVDDPESAEKLMLEPEFVEFFILEDLHENKGAKLLTLKPEFQP